MSFSECKLGEVMTLKRGHDLPERLRKAGDIPIVSSSGITGFHNESKADAPGVVTGRYGTLGEVYFVDEPYWPLNTALYVIDFKGNDPRFVGYFLRSVLRNYRSDKAAVPGVDRNVLHAMDVKAPDPQTQRRIASILSAYDDLIENNRRRIALLEEAAGQLYKEWFVRFRFPGHEHVPIVDGVPEGWTLEPLGNLTTKLGSGATPRGGAGAYKTSGITLIRSLNVYDYSFHDEGLVFIDDDQARKLSNVVVEPMDVLLNITGASVARCCLVPPRHLPARVNQHVMILRADPEKCGPNFLLHSINSYQRKEKLLSIARSGGATREALTKDTMAGFEILMPTGGLVEAFEDSVSPLFVQSEKLAESNAKLAQARDLLLPKLMSGEIAV